MLTPALIMVFIFIAYPMIYSFLLTFSEFSISETHWFASGFSNYQTLFQDRAFLRAIEFTIGYTVFYVPISVALALVIGVLLHQLKIGATFFRSMLFLPSVIPLSLGFLMFQWVLDPNNGIFNYILGNLLGQTDFYVAWLNDRSTVLGTMIAITLWGFGPWILMLAGLLAIPQTLYEAARVRWREFVSGVLLYYPSPNAHDDHDCNRVTGY